MTTAVLTTQEGTIKIFEEDSIGAKIIPALLQPLTIQNFSLTQINSTETIDELEFVETAIDVLDVSYIFSFSFLNYITKNQYLAISNRTKKYTIEIIFLNETTGNQDDWKVFHCTPSGSWNVLSGADNDVLVTSCEYATSYLS